MAAGDTIQRIHRHKLRDVASHHGQWSPAGLNLAFCLWAFFLPLSGIRIGATGALSDIPLYASALPTLIWLSYQTTLRVKWFACLFAALWIGAIATLVGTLHAVEPGASLVNGVKFWATVTLITLVFCTLRKDPANLNKVCWAYVLGTTLMAITTWTLPGPGERATGLAGNPVEVGCLASVAICLAFYLPPVLPFAWITRWICIGLCVSSLGSSLSLTGAIASVIGLAAAAVVARRISVKGLMLIPIGWYLVQWLISSTDSGVYLLDKLNRSFSSDTPAYQNSLEDRRRTIEVSWERIQDHLWSGNGYDPAGQVSYWTYQPHSIFLLAWQAGGILAIGVIVALLLLSLRNLIGRVDSNSAMTSAAQAAAVAGWIVVAGGPSLYQRSWMFPVLLLVSARLSPFSVEGGPETHRPVGEPPIAVSPSGQYASVKSGAVQVTPQDVFHPGHDPGRLHAGSANSPSVAVMDVDSAIYETTLQGPRNA